MKLTFILTLLAPLVGVFSCAKREHKEQIHEHSLISPELKNKKALYCKLGREYGEAKNWNISTCDSLLVASLWAVACGEVPLEKFHDMETGQAFRTTTHDCFPGPGEYGGSATDISKDMYRGAFLAWLFYGRLDLVNKTIQYGSANSWVMGSGKDEFEIASRCVLSPEMISEVYDLQDFLEGGSPSPNQEQKLVEQIQIGYKAHLQIINVLFDGKLYKGITDGELSILKGQSERQPDNAIFNFSYHRYAHEHPLDNAVSILMNTQYFPNDRLPSSSDRCSDYIFSHDKADHDWLPCPDKKPGEVFSGTEFVFAVSILDGTFDQAVPIR